ncbi:MAG: hypothetical protein R3F62_02925 [Planctomycetota bacterium]
MARAQTGGADLAILALGKLGGNELNYSSDVDLVLVRGDDVPLPAALRTARVLVDLLHRRTSTGGLYRVDLRLRPHGKLGPRP